MPHGYAITLATSGDVVGYVPVGPTDYWSAIAVALTHSGRTAANVVTYETPYQVQHWTPDHHGDRLPLSGLTVTFEDDPPERAYRIQWCEIFLVASGSEPTRYTRSERFDLNRRDAG